MRPRLGASLEDGGTRFAAFTDGPECAVRLLEPGSLREIARHPLHALGDGYFELLVPGVGAGSLYDFVIGERVLPDPYARFLPRGVHGPASIVAPPQRKRPALPQRKLRDYVVYELHVGTFTPEGTFASAAERLPDLVDLGVTAIELMPIAAFNGERGWGYDGVALYAPHASYGTPQALMDLVDAAHQLGLSMVLDVVYNHFGPSGNYLSAYSTRYFHADLQNPWGNAPDFGMPAMRELVLGNVRYWLEEFGFDALRLDATHAIVDDSPRHLLQEIAEIAHACEPPRLVFAEDDRNLAPLVTEFGMDALWADDFHHQVRVTLTGERDGYYACYEPGASGIAQAINDGWVYAGQRYPTSGEARGTKANSLLAEQLVYCIQNHDQIGNRAFGDRLSQSLAPEEFRAVSLLLLLLPMTPLLFMGQEWGAGTPFLYFTDHDGELGEAVRQGRRREFARFAQFADPKARESIPDPQAPETFAASRLNWAEREQAGHAATLALYRRSLELRRSDAVLARAGRRELEALALGEVLCVRRWWGDQERLILVNFGARDVTLAELGLSADRQVLLASDPSSPAVLSARRAQLLAGAHPIRLSGAAAAAPV